MESNLWYKLSQIADINLRLNYLENRNRRNNIIFKDLNHEGEVVYVSLVKELCVSVIGAWKDFWVNRAHALGVKRKDGLVISHFPGDYVVNSILCNARILKGAEYVMH